MSQREEPPKTESSGSTLLVVAPTRRELGGLRVGSLGPVWVAVTGLGKPAAAILSPLATEQRPTAVLSLGFAGALSPEHSTGALVVCERFVAGESSPPLPADGTLVEAARKAGGSAKVAAAGLLTVPAPLLTAAEKKAARSASGAAVVDMEGYWMAQVAAEHQLPFLAVRAVLDGAHVELPRLVSTIVADGGRNEWRHTARWLLTNPVRLPELLWLAYRSWRAQQALRGAARTLVRALMDTPAPAPVRHRL